MLKRVALALLAFSTPVLAQPTTPTVVETPATAAPLVTPHIFHKGNLRLSISCAESWVTPTDGLAVAVDGATVDPLRVNGSWATYSDDNGGTSDVFSPSDTGYLMAPGHHHVQIDAPGCAPSAFDMDAYADHSQHADGRLAVSDSALMGPVGAPNGFGITLGMQLAPTPMGPQSNSIFNQTAAFDPGTTATGAYLSLSFERRYFTLGTDFGFASGPISGTVSGNTSQPFGGNQPVTQPFTGSANVLTTQVRVGARLPLHDVALMAGSGVGVEAWADSASLVGNQTQLFAPSGIDGSFYLPMWAGATIKPACNWGFQVIGQYDVHPTSMDTNGFAISGGIMYQPSASCSEPAGVRVSPN